MCLYFSLGSIFIFAGKFTKYFMSRLIQEEIAQLEQKKKDLSEQITNKAKDAVAKIRERTSK